MELFVIKVNGWNPWTIITKCSILDVAVVLDPSLQTLLKWSGSRFYPCLHETFSKLLESNFKGLLLLMTLNILLQRCTCRLILSMPYISDFKYWLWILHKKAAYLKYRLWICILDLQGYLLTETTKVKTKAYSEPSGTSKMEVFAKCTILDVPVEFEYVSWKHWNNWQTETP